MNPFHNPAFLLRVAKSYLSDVNRVWKFDIEELKRYQDKAFRLMVRYAYTVPVYHEKYKKHGVHPDDIKGVNDCGKLPFISKDDLRGYYPEGITPKGFDKKRSYLLSTSGSTGKPVFVYCDVFSSIRSLEGFVRALKAYGGSWSHSKVALVIDCTPGSVEHAFFGAGITPVLKRFLPLKNIKYFHIGEKPEKLIQEINEFQPEFFGSDPNMLRELAYLKNRGLGEKIAPRYLFSGGSILDMYTRKYVEHAFHTRILDTYGTTEAGPLAFQCLDGDYHVHSDFVLLEFLDKKKQSVSFGKPGQLVVTKLYGTGTPVIRYTGIEDMVIPLEPRSCKHGLTTEMIKHIEGRSVDLIILPNGKLLSSLTLTGIPAKIMEEYQTYKIKQFQIIQHEVDDLEVLVVIDENLRTIGPSVETILKVLQSRFQDGIGPEVRVQVTETENIQKGARSDYIKVCISKVKKPLE